MGFIRQTGVTYADPKHLNDGTFIIYSGADAKTRIVDLNGNVVKQWKYPSMPGRVLDPAIVGKNGHVLLQLSDTGDARSGIYSNRTIGQVDWKGKVLWEWGSKVLGGAVRQNHDWQLLSNGNWLVLGTALRVIPDLGPETVGDQTILEVDSHGQVVWSWLAGDHIDELGLSDHGLTLFKEAFARDVDDPWGPFEINNAQTLVPNKWYDRDAEKYSQFHPDNIIISYRKLNVVAIIDKFTGHFAWRLGPYFEEKSGDEHKRILQHHFPRPVDQISGQHNPHFIQKGLPGAGNILLFDCQGAAGFPPAALGKYSGSRVLEINPATKEIVWQYTAEDSGLPPWTFFSSFVSNAQRLPNGNTLITEGMQGRIFQVTSTGQVVWEYYSPYTGNGAPAEPGKPKFGASDKQRVWETPLVYRSYAVSLDWLPDSVKKTKIKPVGKSKATSTALIQRQRGNKVGLLPFIRAIFAWK